MLDPAGRLGKAMRKPALTAAAAALALTALSGCDKRLEPPLDRGVCYHVAFDEDGEARFNVVAQNMPNIENCAAQLEGMRLRFARMGSYQSYLVGSYQGSFIFIQREGVFVSKTFEGNRYLALVRTGDGRLAMPGAVPNY